MGISEAAGQEIERRHDRRPSSARCLFSLLLALALALQACVAPSSSDGRAPKDDGGSDSSTQPEAPVVNNARWQAMWLVAGSPPPPDLPAALVTARLERAASALGMVAELLEGEDAEDYQSSLRALFLDDTTPDLLWCAAARASASLRLEEVASIFATNLESERSARRVAAADALHEMRGAWFKSSSEAMEHLAAGPPPSGEHLETLNSITRRAHEYAAELFALDKSRAADALDDVDPKLRVLAARALAQVFAASDTEGGFDPARARAALLKRLEIEEHPEPFFALVSAFLEQLGPADICTHDARAFSAALHARAASCDVTLVAPIAHGLARMPLDPELSSRDEAGVPDACSMALAEETLETLLVEWLQQGRLVDADSLASALRSLETLFERPLIAASKPALSGVLLDAIEDPARTPSVRTGAARALALVGRPEDLPRLAACLQEAPTDVAYELVATITQLVEGVEISSESAIAARDALVATLSLDEASLRQRALSLLATEPLAPLAETTDARLFLLVLEQDLSTEDSEVLLELLSRRRAPELVDGILASSAFSRLADPASGTAGFLALALGKLAAGDGPRTFAAATQLMKSAGAVDRVQRLRNALALHAALPDLSAQSLQADEHATIVRWSLELREAAGSLAGVTAEPVPIAFLERLIDVHLVRCAEDAERARWAHPTALLLADLFDAFQFDSGDLARVPFVGRTTGNFERALGYARSTPEREDDLLVLRDRARFNVAAGDTYRALSDYRDVVKREAEPSNDPEAPSSVLGLTDLRRAATLAADKALSGPADLPSAVDLTLALISREAWSSESQGVRLEDLRALVERAGLSEPDRARVRPLFVGLPVPEIDLAGAVLPKDVPWLGLEGDPEQLIVLRALADDLDEPLSPEPSSEAPEAGSEAPGAVDPESLDEPEGDSAEVPERRS